MAEHHLRHQPATFMYLFDQTSPVQGGELGSCHALDVPFTFGAFDAPGITRLTGEGEAPRRVADRILDAWTTFAREGRPDAPDAWPAYDPARRATMMIGPRPGGGPVASARPQASRPSTRIAFSRRNFGQTWSLKGTFGMSPKMRSSDSPIGKYPAYITRSAPRVFA